MIYEGSFTFCQKLSSQVYLPLVSNFSKNTYSHTFHNNPLDKKLWKQSELSSPLDTEAGESVGPQLIFFCCFFIFAKFLQGVAPM